MERNCTLLLHYDAKAGGAGVAPTEDEIRAELESSNPENKVRGMKTLIMLLLNGHNMPKLLMTVIRYCVTTRDHELKKLLCIYWEVVQKVDAEGRPLSEMLLVCNSLLQNLQHPNHYVRGLTLRFLVRATTLFHSNADLLQPLLPVIVQSITHQEAYVRKYALLALISFAEDFPEITADTSEGSVLHEVCTLLETENDKAVRRNAFLLLTKVNAPLAIKFYLENAANIIKFGQDFQFTLLQLIRDTCRKDVSQKSRFIKTLFYLMTQGNSYSTESSTAIVYEAAYTLTLLTSAPTAARAAAEAYLGILNHVESDNNVKLIVLRRLEELWINGGKGKLVEIMEIARVVKNESAGIDVKVKALSLVLEMVDKRSVSQVVTILREIVDKFSAEEVAKTNSKGEDDEVSKFKKAIIKGVHECVIRFPDIVKADDGNEVISSLISLLTSSKSVVTDGSSSGNVEVVLLLREIVESFPLIRKIVLEKLLLILPDIASLEVVRVVLWIFGEYTLEVEETGFVDEVWDGIFEGVGKLPLSIEGLTLREDSAGAEEKELVQKTTVTVLEDGTYATQAAVAVDESNAYQDTDPGLRKLILGGSYLAGTCMISALMKILLKTRASGEAFDYAKLNARILQVTSFAVNLLDLGESKELASNLRIDKDSFERINLYIKVLLDAQVADQVENVLLVESRKNLQGLIEASALHSPVFGAQVDEAKTVDPDAKIELRQLGTGGGFGLISGEEDVAEEEQIKRATLGLSSDTIGGENLEASFRKELQSIHQLTGFSDAVYCEANVHVHSYDILLDFLLVNRTNNTLVDLTLELGTLGESLQLVDRPESLNLAPGACVNVKASVKVKSTESGQIFGTIVYERSEQANGSPNRVAFINLNYISIDIMDYIRPASCSPDKFRSMWAEFEWENKVTVNTDIKDVYQFLDHIVRSTNMKCLNIKDLTKQARNRTKMLNEGKEVENDFVDFLAANLYAQSVFGEDALVNVSIEKVEGKVEGHIRIRAKTQGIALSLGDKFNIQQKKLSVASLEVLQSP
eukprot:maker-scaffold_5-snap-gene-1.59-mRNA-1 protein AED:0.02 eAED:0.04 QI:0/0/0/1/1/1/4/0/1034